MNKTKLIFNYQLDGHNLEYLHHLYMGASNRPNTNYVFVLPIDFQKNKNVFEWPLSANITFHFYNLKEVKSHNPLVTAFKSSCFLRKVSIKYEADEVLLIWMMAVLPFITFFLPRNIKISGIVYNIYLYFWKEASGSYKIANVLKYLFLAKSRSIDKVYILNDAPAVRKLNALWNTSKFKYLADPVVEFKKDTIKDLREELGIDSGKTICLHAGAMSFKKGTLTILNMIENSSQEALSSFCFVFVGRIYPDIRDEFYLRVNNISNKVQIIVKDDFVSYEYLGSMYKTCDVVLLPYTRVDASSGSIAYASQFKKTVVASNKGLLAKLIRKYGIGFTTSTFDDVSILNKDKTRVNTYCESHTIELFNKILLG